MTIKKTFPKNLGKRYFLKENMNNFVDQALEIHYIIFSYLDNTDLTSLRSTCKIFYDAINSYSLFISKKLVPEVIKTDLNNGIFYAQYFSKLLNNPQNNSPFIVKRTMELYIMMMNNEIIPEVRTRFSDKELMEIIDRNGKLKIYHGELMAKFQIIPYVKEGIKYNYFIGTCHFFINLFVDNKLKEYENPLCDIIIVKKFLHHASAWSPHKLKHKQNYISKLKELNVNYYGSILPFEEACVLEIKHIFSLLYIPNKSTKKEQLRYKKYKKYKKYMF